ncbi:PREDICTED: mitotic spindle assembly checkpoint protein MAD2A-like [Acropora digitifera]|uniref:mitotic spindle assembly checkpoint protein MAD2A-like n=1 Tax=Acropora digitifera TaxID=70779 RepID=UPI00077ACE19|nr:PREDICTED: mitotic spindle assembly checkpoint protein MAD2A-like [Acropora digitifera]
MAATKQENTAITLKGSAELVTEFFGFGINNILYQRGIYPAESFKREQHYDLTLFICDNKELQEYLSSVLKQLKDWLEQNSLQRVVMVITQVDTEEVLERWQFDIQCEKTGKEATGNNKQQSKKKPPKSKKDIQREIRDVIRQITASVTFLPLLEGQCAFDLLVYTNIDQDIPDTWEESQARIIAKSEEVRLRSFSTTIHKVDTMVSYKAED